MYLLRYLKSLLRHKWFVFVEGLKVGTSLKLLVFHDLSKFLPDEFIPYARYFYGYKRGEQPPLVKDAFNKAWLKHQRRNKHHWQYWTRIVDGACRCDERLDFYVLFGKTRQILVNDDDGIYCLSCNMKVDSTNVIAVPMSWEYVLETVADWRGAGRAYATPDRPWTKQVTDQWYENHKDKIIMDPTTRLAVEAALTDEWMKIVIG